MTNLKEIVARVLENNEKPRAAFAVREGQKVFLSVDTTMLMAIAEAVRKDAQGSAA
jgi:hypothetical protein